MEATIESFWKDNESLLDCCKQFVSLIERVEPLHGDIAPIKPTEKDKKCKKNPNVVIDREKGKMLLAVAFVEGANKTSKPLLNELEQDCSLGDDKCRATVEEVLQVPLMHEQQMLKWSKKMPKNDDSQPLSLAFAQMNEMKKKGLCFKCGKQGHLMKDCTKNDEKDANKKEGKKDETPEQSHIQQGWQGTECPMDGLASPPKALLKQPLCEGVCWPANVAVTPE